MTSRKAPEDAIETAELPDEPASPLDTSVVGEVAPTDPPEAPDNEAQAAAHQRKTTLVVYRGPADLVVHEAFEFRPDQPVEVPNAMVDEFLTTPRHRFERWEQE